MPPLYFLEGEESEPRSAAPRRSCRGITRADASNPPPLRAKKRFHLRRQPKKREPAFRHAGLGWPSVREEKRHRLRETVRTRFLESEEIPADGERQARGGMQ